jgi:hypothetical protein
MTIPVNTISCKYYDCGWCYAPDDVKTNTIQSACFEPEHCPYPKSQNQMTNEQTLECEIKEYALKIEQKTKEIGELKDILDRKEQQLKQMKAVAAILMLLFLTPPVITSSAMVSFHLYNLLSPTDCFQKK